MPDDAPDDGSTGDQEEIWFGDDPEPGAANDAHTEDDGDPVEDDGDALPSAVGGSKGRLIIGLVILLFGVAVAVAAISQQGSDDDASSAPKGETAAKTTTTATGTTTVPVRTPTTIAGGALPTGCADWDGTFGFQPEPVDGVAVWSDFEGWHIRVSPDGPSLVTGTVAGQVVPVLPEGQFLPAGVEVSADPTSATVVFSITPGLQPTGFDFAADCAQKQLTFQFWGPDGEPLPPEQVQVGRNGSTTEMPFYAQRTMAAG